MAIAGSQVAVAAGAYHSMAVDANGTVRAWGWNVVGQLGDGTTVDRHVAVGVFPPGGAKVVIAGGVYHTLAG